MKTGSLPFDLGRLCTSITRGREMLEFPRRQYRECVKQIAGNRYGNNEGSAETPANLSQLYLSTVKRNLISKDPQVLMTSFKKELKPILSAMQEWENGAIADMKFAQTMDLVLSDALIYEGYLKIALMTTPESANTGWSIEAGTPMAVYVPFENWVIDPHAPSWEAASFMGHCYKVPLDTVKNSKEYDKSVTKDMQPTILSTYNEQGDEKVGTIGTGESAVTNEGFEDWVILWEIYLPKHKCIVTLYDRSGNGPELAYNNKPLKIQDWVGPPCGPYHRLGFGTVQGNIMKKGPLLDLLSLDLAYNELLSQLIRQARRQKELIVGSLQSADDMKKMREANDGDPVGVANPDSVKSISLSGPNQVNLAFSMQIYQLFSQMAGNLALLGGLSKQSNTATQDKMLNENASATIMDKQETVINYTTDTLRALTWYWWYDPNKTYSSQFSVPGLAKYSIERQVRPQDRIRYAYSDMKIRIDPYSLIHQTPAQKAAKIKGLVMQIFMPMAQILQQQGIAFDASEFLRILGQYEDMPEYSDILKYMEPPETETNTREPGGGENGLMSTPMDYEKNYTRTSVSNGPSEEGMMRDQMNQMLNRPAEQAA